MKITIEFNLPEDKDQHIMAINGPRYWKVLWELSTWLRTAIKHNPDELDSKTLDIILDELYELLDEACVTLEEIE